MKKLANVLTWALESQSSLPVRLHVVSDTKHRANHLSASVLLSRLKNVSSKIFSFGLQHVWKCPAVSSQDQVFSATQKDRNVRRQLVLWPRFCLEMLCCVPASHQMCLLSEATKMTKTVTMSRPKYSVLGTKTSKIYIFYQPNTAGNVPTSDPKRCRSPLWLQLSRASCVSSTLQGSETSVRRLW